MAVFIQLVANCAVCGKKDETKNFIRIGNMLTCFNCGFDVRNWWDSRNEVARLTTCGYQGSDDRQEALDGIANLLPTPPAPPGEPD